jgi:hypothetical protein
MNRREDIEKPAEEDNVAKRWWKLTAEDKEFLRSCNITPS